MQNEITELRNQVRTLKRIVYGFGCLLVAGVVVSATSMQTVPDVIEAKRFIVVNDEGMGVVVLSATKDGSGVLNISNNDEKIIAKLHCINNGGVLNIRNKDGKTFAAIHSGLYGEGMLTIYNKDGTPVAELSDDADGGKMTIQSTEGKRVCSLMVNKSIGAFLVLGDNKGETTFNSLSQ